MNSTNTASGQGSEQDGKREVTFSNTSEAYCISFVDIIGSSQITSNLYKSGEVINFYSVFINEIAGIVKNYGGRILKTVGDGVIFFFPATCDVENQEAFGNAIGCLVQMVSSSNAINNRLHRDVPATISYRISADYGRLEEAISGEEKSTYDLFGTTLNFCTKINKKAPANGIVIGADLWRVLNSFPRISKQFFFQEVEELKSNEKRYSYPVYLLRLEKSSGYKKLVQSPAIESSKEKIEFSQKKLRVLFIDDDPDISLSFELQLKAAGIIVDTFTNSEEALRHFIRSRYSYYDVIVTDIRMPGLNGFELYHQLKAFEPTIRILFLTALDITSEVISLLPELKLSQFITKPVDPKVLVSKLWQFAINQ